MQDDAVHEVENGLGQLTLGPELTKQSIREQVWDYLEKSNIAKFPRPVSKRIPNYEGAAQACDNLPGLDAFKTAQTVKVNPDKPQEQARFLVLERHKNLLVPTPRLRSGLFNRITPPRGEGGKHILRVCATSQGGKTLVVTPLRRSARKNVLHRMEPPKDASDKDLRLCSRYQGVKEYSVPVGFESKVHVDLVVVGCVAASKTDFDECTSHPCGNGAKCTDHFNRFYCDCPRDWKGVLCETKMAVVMSPPVNGSFVDGDLPIFVQFPGFNNEKTSYIFNYGANPKLTKVEPLKTNVIGGTTVTVSGKNLDVIGDPVMEVTMVHTFTNDGRTAQDVTMYTGDCKISSSTVMLCYTPAVDVPPTFNNWEEKLQYSNPTDSHGSTKEEKRSKREEKAVVDVKIDDETLEFYIGFRLDGVKTYGNLSETKDLAEFSRIIYRTTEPKMEMTEFPTFVPYSSMKIKIKGSDLMAGFEESDYEVGIGAGWCGGMDVTDNEIVCAPPDELPLDSFDQRRKRRSLTSDELPVVIYIGTNLQNRVGTITYQLSTISDLQIYIIAGSLGALVILAIIGGIIVFKCRKSHVKSDTNQTNELSSIPDTEHQVATHSDANKP